MWITFGPPIPERHDALSDGDPFRGTEDWVPEDPLTSRRSIIEPHDLRPQYRQAMRPALAIVLASVLLPACGGGEEPRASVTTTTPTTPTTTTTAAPGEALEFCAAGEEYIRNYEDANYARDFDPAELRAIMERGNVLTDHLGAEAPPDIQLSMKAVAAAFDKRRTLYGNHDYVIGAVTPEENRVLDAVEVDVEDSEQRMHDYLVSHCGIAL